MIGYDLDNLKHRAEDHQMTYCPFQYPIGTNDDATKLVFSFGTVDNELLITSHGMNLLLQHLYGFVDRTQARNLYNAHDLVGFADYLNQCRTKQEQAHLWRKNQRYILAVNDHHIFGVLANYNPKSNVTVVEDVEQSGLASNLKRWWIDDLAMNIYLGYQSIHGFELGLNVRNGETGHTTLSYRLYVRNGEYTFDTPSFGKRRHLSNLALVEDDINRAYGELNDIKFHDYVTDTPTYQYATLILDDPKLEKLHELVLPYQTKLRQLYTLLGFLSSQRGVRSWKTICNQALDKLYTAIMEEL